MKKTNLYVEKSLKAVVAFLFVVIISAGYTACSANEDNPSSSADVSAMADAVWEFSQSHPDGFTIHIQTMTVPTEGIAVSYAATQNSHSRDQLDFVVTHALQHDGYVGGWLNPENGQTSVYIMSTGTEVYIDYD